MESYPTLPVFFETIEYIGIIEQYTPLVGSVYTKNGLSEGRFSRFSGWDINSFLNRFSPKLTSISEEQMSFFILTRQSPFD
jgi:hypothetical protein